MSRKRARTSDSEEEESDYSARKNNSMSMHDDEDEDEEVVEDIIRPEVMAPLIQEFANYAKRNGKEGTMAKFIHRIAVEFLRTRDDEIDVDKFIKSYRKYALLANKTMSLKTSSDSLLEYLDKGEVVKFFSGYPKQPPNLLIYYCRKYNIPFGFGKQSAAKSKMLKDTTGRSVCEKELQDAEKKFLVDLERFAEENENNFSENQTNYLQTKIKAYKKKIFPVEPKTPRAAAKRKSQAPQTAFEYFCRTMTDKYADLEPEARERKLQKKFRKLDEPTKGIFEKLALSS